MIGRTNAGGGVSDINFRVLGGTSAPSSPKANDIWVNTSVAIPSWEFRKAFTAPTNTGKPTGFVYISAVFANGYDARTSQEINLFKKNGLYAKIYPAYQWSGSAWVKKTAKVYTNGAWNNAIGDYYIVQNSAAVLPMTGSNPLSASGSNTSYYTTTEMYDLSDYSSVSRKTTKNAGSTSSAPTITLEILNSAKTVVASGSNRTFDAISVNVKSLTGQHYIRYSLKNSSSSTSSKMTIDEIKVSL